MGPVFCMLRRLGWRASGSVQNGDMIEVDIAARTLNLLVDEAELAKRKANWTPPQKQRGAAINGYLPNIFRGRYRM